MESHTFLVHFIACSCFCLVYGAVLKVTIEPSANPVFFVKGRSLVLTCVVHTDENVDIVWTKDEIPVEDREYKIDTWAYRDSAGPTKHARLTKMAAGSSDVAIFRCSAKGVDKITETSIFQIVTAGSSISEGHNSSLRCQTDLNYEVRRITWYKGNQHLSEIAGLRERIVLGHENSSILLLNARLSDSGVYTCQVEIDPDTDIQQVFQEKVALQGKPFISQHDTHEMHKNTNDYSIVLGCRVNGYPVPDVFWKKGEYFLESSDKTQISARVEDGTSQLKINNPTSSDFDQYTCIAESSLGKASYVFNLTNSGATALTFKLVLYDYSFFGVSLYAAVAVFVMKLTK